MRPAAKGWCPGAHRPMESGDGLIVRVRPHLGRLTAAQVAGLCAAARAHGSGILEFTRRANLQIRGVGAGAHDALLHALGDLGLIDADPAREARRNILTAPLWQAGDDTETLAHALAARLDALPALPAKFGFAIDAGTAPMLAGASADLRIERGASGGLILRPDGAAAGAPVVPGAAVAEAIAAAHRFVRAGAVGRVARLPDPAALIDTPVEPPASHAPIVVPGPTPLGPARGVAFGQIEADALADLVARSGAAALRLTPWRVLILEGGAPVAAEGVIADPGDALLRTDACPGAPFCPAASVETRALARRLAPHVAGRLHVSGCAKGCARTDCAEVTLTGREGRFDLIRDGRPWDAPAHSALGPDAAAAALGAR